MSIFISKKVWKILTKNQLTKSPLMPIRVKGLLEVHLPEHAWGGKGNISVVELFLLATAQPRL